MLLTSPLVVTVGISMTIPLSLIGQIVLSSQYSSAWYWLGACIVLLSFLFINHETKEEDDPSKPHQRAETAEDDDRLYR
jgi:solute carrier family 35 protein F5